MWLWITSVLAGQGYTGCGSPQCWQGKVTLVVDHLSGQGKVTLVVDHLSAGRERLHWLNAVGYYFLYWRNLNSDIT